MTALYETEEIMSRHVGQTTDSPSGRAFPAVTGSAVWARLWAFLGSAERVEALERYGTLAARILIGQIFLLSGVMKIMDPSGTMAQMEGRGMFWVPLFFVAATAVELIGGLSLLLGFKARLGALLLLLFLIPVTLTFHNFWTYPPEEQRMQMILFMHNLTLMGGLLLVMTIGPGPLSIDLWGKKPS
jgi:putative oxidoreductase